MVGCMKKKKPRWEGPGLFSPRRKRLLGSKGEWVRMVVVVRSGGELPVQLLVMLYSSAA